MRMAAANVPLSWWHSSDPELDDISDWAIDVCIEESEEKQSYHVHKSVLAYGARSCGYFETQFSTKAATAELKNNTSRIRLDQEQAKAFPKMLDFLYGVDQLDSNAPNIVTTDNAVVLRSLARYFFCPALLKEVNSFIGRDLKPKTAVQYLCSAIAYCDELVRDSAKNLILEKYNSVTKDTSLADLPFETLRSIVCSPEFSKCYHASASADILKYFEKHSDELTAQKLCGLTAKLTAVSESAADGLLGLVRQLMDRNEVSKDAWPALYRVCNLCVSSMASDWHMIGTQQYREWYQEFQKSPTAFRLQMDVIRLLAIVERAQQENAQQEARIADLEARLGGM